MFDDLLRNALNKPLMDSCGKEECNKKDKPMLDGADDYSQKYIDTQAAAALQQWAETDDLEEGESLGDRLLALLVGVADGDKDGDLTEAEQDVISEAIDSAYRYLINKGVPADDAEKLLEEFDNDVATRVKDLLVDNLPDGDKADEDIDNFAFTKEENEPAFDAVYKKKLVIRGGKKVRINKRVSGTVRLTAKQKMAIRKAQRKAHSASALMRRMKSMRIRRRTGLK